MHCLWGNNAIINVNTNPTGASPVVRGMRTFLAAIGVNKIELPDTPTIFQFNEHTLQWDGNFFKLKFRDALNFLRTIKHDVVIVLGFKDIYLLCQ